MSDKPMSEQQASECGPKTAFDKLMDSPPDRTNERGCRVWTRGPFLEQTRYAFDVKWCAARGWKQYDTWQDAPYFGVWVHVQARLVVTFAEGDLSVVHAPTAQALQAELESMAEFYGAAPPAFILLDADGNRTDIYDPRPTGREGESS